MSVADRILGIILLLLALVCLVEGIRVWDGMGGTGFMPVIKGRPSSGHCCYLLSGDAEQIVASPYLLKVSRQALIPTAFLSLTIFFFLG